MIVSSSDDRHIVHHSLLTRNAIDYGWRKVLTVLIQPGYCYYYGQTVEVKRSLHLPLEDIRSRNEPNIIYVYS